MAGSAGGPPKPVTSRAGRPVDPFPGEAPARRGQSSGRGPCSWRSAGPGRGPARSPSETCPGDSPRVRSVSDPRRVGAGPAPA